MENKYKQLEIPKDSAWGKKTWKTYSPVWLKNIITGIHNILKWMPTIYKDRDWDHWYIYEVIKKKLYFQRKYLVKHNRHTSVPEINKYITICLNLIDRIQEDYYDLEYFDYHHSEYEFIPTDDTREYFEMKSTNVWEKYDDYFQKYPNVARRLLKQNTELHDDKQRLAMRISSENDERCRKLLFKILHEKIEGFWD